MKIALIGVPGAGKSDLAKHLADKLDPECDGRSTIIDNYASEVSEYIDIAKGLSASWYLDLQISLERLARERQAKRDAFDHVITCGTLIESTSYSMLNFENRKAFKMENEIPFELARIEAAMKVFACLYQDTFSYDLICFLNQVKPTEEDTEMFKVLDRNIQASFEAFKLTHISKDLTVETTDIEEATTQRLEMIGDLNAGSSEGEDVQPEESDGLGVREGEKALRPEEHAD